MIAELAQSELVRIEAERIAVRLGHNASTSGALDAKTSDQAVALSGDRAIVAFTTLQLAIIHLGAGKATVVAGPTLASRANSLALSLDGKLLALARPIDATTSMIEVWAVEGDTLTFLDAQQITATVSSVAITAPVSVPGVPALVCCPCSAPTPRCSSAAGWSGLHQGLGPRCFWRGLSAAR